MIPNIKFEGIGMTSQRTRSRLVSTLRKQGIRRDDVLSVIESIPRHLFVDEALASRAYENTALPIGFNQTISQPYVVARMTELLLNSEREVKKVLEIGTGSGYQSAVLAEMVQTVISVERISELQLQARRVLSELKLRNIIYRVSDGYIGCADFAPFDGILVAAAPEQVPQALLDQLAIGARLVLPVGNQNQQFIKVVTRRDSEDFSEQISDPVSFVPMLTGSI